MKKIYQHIFFDLDRTLWDFEANASVALQELFDNYKLQEKGVPDFNFFVKVYKNINQKLWKKLRNGKVTKDYLRTARFKDSLLYFGIVDNDLAKKIGDEYVNRASEKTQLIDGARDILEYLQPKYKLHIISNGFEEAQFTKLKNCKLEQYFDEVILSETAHASKPHTKIFEYAMQKTNADRDNSIMIGDDLESDIRGALDFGIDCVYFNPESKPIKNNIKPTYIIQRLQELYTIL